MVNFSKSEAGLDLAALGRRIRLERQRHSISLEALCRHSGVSRSMISAIERGAKAPTVLVLDKIATGLETSLSRLLAAEVKSRVHVLRSREQSVARDPAGWERRILSPVLPGVEFEFMRTTLNSGVAAGVFLPHAHGSREYVAVEKGTLDLTIDGELYELAAGDSIFYDGDCLHGFANSRATACVYYLAMDVSGDPIGTQHRAAHRTKAGKDPTPALRPRQRILETQSNDQSPPVAKLSKPTKSARKRGGRRGT